MILFIGSVNLDSLAYLGKYLAFFSKIFFHRFSHIITHFFIGAGKNIFYRKNDRAFFSQPLICSLHPSNWKLASFFH